MCVHYVGMSFSERSVLRRIMEMNWLYCETGSSEASSPVLISMYPPMVSLAKKFHRLSVLSARIL